MEFQQSPLYARYIGTLNWKVIHTGNVQMFYKKIPFLGGLLKIQRPQKLPPTGTLIKIIKENKIKTVAIEPRDKENILSYKKWVSVISRYCRIVRSGYMPTKTILVDLKPDEKEIFRRLTEAKRRAVRKAQKNGVQCAKNNARISVHERTTENYSQPGLYPYFTDNNDTPHYCPM